VREIRFYRTVSGRSPIEEFLDSLSGKQAQKVVWVLRLLKELDLVPVQYFKKLSDSEDLWEVRVQSAGDSFRFLGFFDGSKLVVLTNAFAKKSQKTPVKEIELAHERRRDYLNRKGPHE
jgi:phage-related protein